MANVLVQESSLQDIADAIRTKNGTQNTYKPAQMADAIEAISGGGITPTGTINITTNGTHDVTNYASASVAVPTGTTPTGTKQVSITQNGTTTEDVTNYASAEITVNVPSSSLSWDDIASGAQPSGAIDLGSATSVKDYFSYWNTRATEWTCTGNSVTYIGQNAFRNNTYLKEIHFPNLESMSTSGWVCHTCTRLEIADLGKVATIRPNMFNSCANLTTLILRGTTRTALEQVASFNGTPFASGGSGGTIYIPEDLYNHLGDGSSSDYKAGTNWSTLDGYGTITWAKLEGSAYE